MSTKQQMIAAVAKLISLTQTGELSWTTLPPSAVAPANDDYVPEIAFRTSYGGRGLRIRLYRFRIHEPGPFSNMLALQVLGGKKTYPYWASSVSLEIVDSDGQSVWTFPNESVIWDLLKVVRLKCSGADELIGELVGPAHPEGNELPLKD